MSILEALILGVIQGLTEFLPVSSSGHLELGAYVLNVKNQNNLLFAIIVHGATALSTLVVFRKTVFQLFTGLFKFEWNNETKFICQIFISMIPVGVVGLLFEEQIELFFAGNILLVAGMLLATGLLLLVTNYIVLKQEKLTFAKAFIIGIAQSIAILPGISRSGATIATALLLGIEKSDASKFSFLMVLPPILGATLLKTMQYLQSTEATTELVSLPSLSIGFIVAFISGLIACTWMINIVRKGKLVYFALYCIAVSIILGSTILIYGS